jgi:hypothetical protein
VVILKGGVPIVSDSVLVALFAGVAESLTRMVTLDVPEVVGIPLIWLPLTLNPAGSPVAENVYGDTPPFAPNGDV